MEFIDLTEFKLFSIGYFCYGPCSGLCKHDCVLKNRRNLGLLRKRLSKDDINAILKRMTEGDLRIVRGLHAYSNDCY